MNRKDVNRYLNAIPVSSTIIGAPRHSATMSEFLTIKPMAGNFPLHLHKRAHSSSPMPPGFFNWEPPCSDFSVFTARLVMARVWGKNGAVIGLGDYFIKDVSREFNKGTGFDHSIFYTIKQVRNKYLPVTAAVIGTAGANIYYHWMLDILPRLSLLSEAIPLNAIDYFISEFASLPFQTETLEKAGVSLDKVLRSNDNWGFHVKVKELFIPSLVGNLDQPNLFQINYLRNLYKGDFYDKMPFRKIYISRKIVGRRTIVNEDELLIYLARNQFEIIVCENMSVVEQVKLFSSASYVISSHGSALTNLVFCQEGVTVLDIFNETHINPCFWFLSKALNLNYNYFTGTSLPIDNNSKNDNTIVDIDAFQHALRNLGLFE